MRHQFMLNELSQAKVFYDDYGFASFPDLLNAEEIDKLHGAYDEALHKGAIIPTDYTGGGDDVIYAHPYFEELCKNPKIVNLARTLIGHPIELQHCKLNAKPNSDDEKGTVAWHQDYPFFPHTNFDLVAIGIHLDEEDLESGPLTVIPGSHKEGLRSHVREGNFTYGVIDTSDFNSKPQIRLTGKIGQVTAHHSLTLHGSDRKRNQKQRRLLVFQYRAQDSIQIAGVLWKCTGYQVMERVNPGFARFPDGTQVEIRGHNGRLFDKFGKLAPDQ